MCTPGILPCFRVRQPDANRLVCGFIIIIIVACLSELTYRGRAHFSMIRMAGYRTAGLFVQMFLLHYVLQRSPIAYRRGKLRSSFRIRRTKGRME